jgi:SanA protein
MKQNFWTRIFGYPKFNYCKFTNILRFFIISICILLLPFWTFNLTTFNYFYARNDNLINNSNGKLSNNFSSQNFKTLLVLGAQVNSYNNQPSGILSERLEKALEVWKIGGIDKILLSGGDREPQVMMNFLEKNGVPKQNLFTDWGGLRTIDSCWRAKNIFKIQKVAIITQEFHLPRATFLCQSTGMQVLPIASANSYLQTQIYGLFREIFACWDSSIDLLNQYKPPIGSDGKEPNLGE